MSFEGSRSVSIKELGTNIVTGALVQATNASGGAPLAGSGITLHGIYIKNVSGTVNSAIHIGSSGNPPYISGGYVLDIGDEKEFHINNPAYVRVFARTSGAVVCWAGVDF